MINTNLLDKAKQKGTDAEYQAWVRLWPSCLTGAYNTVENGVGRCEFAHVRRAGDSGTGYKGQYSGIPLTHDEHALTHQKGESVFCPPEWYEKQAVEYLTKWINGVQSPSIEENKKHFKKEYIIEHPNQMSALLLLLRKHFKKDEAPPVKCTLERHVKRRSLKQNNAQWGVLYDNAFKHYEDNPGNLVLDALDAVQFGIDRDFMHWMFKRLFNKGQSTAKLSTIQSGEYAEKIRHHFLHHHKHDIPEVVSYDGR